MNRSPNLPIVPLGGAQPSRGLLDHWWSIALVCLAAIAPLLVVGIAPLTDLYGHLGRYAVQTELATRPGLQPFFTFEWKLIGNLGGDLVVEALHPLLGLERSVQAMVILTQLLFALAAIPLLYGFPFNYGFINYALSMALAMLAYVAWLRLRKGGREGAAAVWLGVAGAAIWVAHTYGWAFLGLLAGSTMLVEVIAARMHPVRAGVRILAACWPLLLPVVPMVIWRAESSGAAISGWAWQFKFNWAISPLRTYWRDFDIGALVVLALLLVWALFSRTVRYDRRIGLAAVLCLLCFLALPFRVFGSAFADMRLAPYVLALALVAIGPARAQLRVRSRVLLAASALALAFFGVRMVTTGMAYMAQDRHVQAALPALEKMPEGARVAFFSVKPCRTRWALAPLDHLGGAAMARRNAFANDQWQQPGVNPMRVRYPAAEPFVRDPSHLVQRDDCKGATRPKLSVALAKLPTAAFTHIWIVGELPEDLPAPEGFVAVPEVGRSLLFVRRAPLDQAAAR